MAEKFISRRLSKYRSEIYKSSWEKYKSELSMSDLCEILKVGLSQFYKIVTKSDEKDK